MCNPGYDEESYDSWFVANSFAADAPCSKAMPPVGAKAWNLVDTYLQAWLLNEPDMDGTCSDQGPKWDYGGCGIYYRPKCSRAPNSNSERCTKETVRPSCEQLLHALERHNRESVSGSKITIGPTS